jgi:hypothetical protein
MRPSIGHPVSRQETAIGPWQLVGWLHVGGLLAIGFPSDFHLLALSWNGRGLFDLRTCERTARDYADPDGADWIDPDQLSASGIGQFAGRMISIVGLWGGTGHTKTPEGWGLDSRTASGTVESSSLIGPKGSVTPVPMTSATEYRAISFTPSGQFLLLASSSEVEVLRRD